MKRLNFMRACFAIFSLSVFAIACQKDLPTNALDDQAIQEVEQFFDLNFVSQSNPNIETDVENRTLNDTISDARDFAETLFDDYALISQTIAEVGYPAWDQSEVFSHSEITMVATPMTFTTGTQTNAVWLSFYSPVDDWLTIAAIRANGRPLSDVTWFKYFNDRMFDNVDGVYNILHIASVNDETVVTYRELIPCGSVVTYFQWCRELESTDEDGNTIILTGQCEDPQSEIETIYCEVDPTTGNIFQGGLSSGGGSGIINTNGDPGVNPEGTDKTECDILGDVLGVGSSCVSESLSGACQNAADIQGAIEAIYSLLNQDAGYSQCEGQNAKDLLCAAISRMPDNWTLSDLTDELLESAPCLTNGYWSCKSFDFESFGPYQTARAEEFTLRWGGTSAPPKSCNIQLDVTAPYQALVPLGAGGGTGYRVTSGIAANAAAAAMNETRDDIMRHFGQYAPEFQLIDCDFVRHKFFEMFTLAFNLELVSELIDYYDLDPRDGPPIFETPAFGGPYDPYLPITAAPRVTDYAIYGFIIWPDDCTE